MSESLRRCTVCNGTSCGIDYCNTNPDDSNLLDSKTREDENSINIAAFDAAMEELGIENVTIAKDDAGEAIAAYLKHVKKHGNLNTSAEHAQESNTSSTLIELAKYKETIRQMYKFIGRDFGHLEPLEAFKAWGNRVLEQNPNPVVSSEITFDAKEMKRHVAKLIDDCCGQNQPALASLIVDYCIDARPMREIVGWKRIKDEPPPQGRIVLLWALTDWETKNWKMASGYLRGDGFYSWDGSICDKSWHEHPTHWQPLPNPPEIEGQS